MVADLSSDSGVMLLALADRRLQELPRCLPLLLPTIAIPRTSRTRLRMCCAPACWRLAAVIPMATTLTGCASITAFKLACGRLPDSGGDLCSQPTISRWENAPTLREIIRLTYALVDIWCRSYQKPPRSVVLDIDDTVVVVHGHQQLAQWNAHYDERCFLPIDVYDARRRVLQLR